MERRVSTDPVPPNRLIPRLTTGRGSHHTGPTVGSSSDISRPMTRTRVAAHIPEDRLIDSVAMTVEQWNELNATTPQPPSSTPQNIPAAQNSRTMDSSRLVEAARLATRASSAFRGQTSSVAGQGVATEEQGVDAVLRRYLASAINENPNSVSFENFQRFMDREDLAAAQSSLRGLTAAAIAPVAQAQTSGRRPVFPEFSSSTYFSVERLLEAFSDKLNQRIGSLEGMIEQTMDMVLELQRGQRQELSATLRRLGEHVEGSAGELALLNQKGSLARKGTCVVCLEEDINCLLYKCGHMCTCLKCGLKLSSTTEMCPMCRAPIEEIVRAYFPDS